MCNEIMRKNQISFYHIPDHLKTQNMCDEAVRNMSWQLEYVPDCFKAQEMCDKAVGVGSYILECIPFFSYQNDIHVFTNNIYNIKIKKKHIYIKLDNTTAVS